MRIPTSFRLLAPLTLVAAAACAPSGGEDAGLSDAAQQEDAGPVDAGHDAGHDAGEPPPPTDSGQSGECPTIGPLSSPEGEPCDEEGKVCRESGCLAPGPSCLFIECHNGVWVNQSLIDGGVSGEDAGETGDDAGAPDDAGSDDADAGADGGDDDGGDTGVDAG